METRFWNTFTADQIVFQCIGLRQRKQQNDQDASKWTIFFLEGNESVYIIVPKSINTIDDILWGKRWHQNEYQLMDTLYWCPTTIYYIFHMRRWNLEIYNFAGIQGISTKSTGSWYSVLYYKPVNLDETPCISIWKQRKVYSALISA